MLRGYFIGIFGSVVCLSIPMSAKAGVDSSVGKSPAIVLLQEGPRGGDSYSWKDWLLHGSRPWVISTSPPRSTGPGLQYDTHRYFYIYSDYRGPQNHFIPSGWMGDYSDIHLDDRFAGDPADGKTCIKIFYSAQRAQGAGWAGVYWQQPMNNWGDQFGGYDLTGMKRLTFWVKGAQGGEVISEFKVGGISGQFHDSGSAVIGPVVLTDGWQQLSIDLAGIDLKHIMGGFAWSVSADQNHQGLTFYMDEIRFER